MNIAPMDGVDATLESTLAMFSAIMSFVYIPADKVPNRPRRDTLVHALETTLRVRGIFSKVLGSIHLDVVRLGFLIPLIKTGREVLRHTSNFFDLAYNNVALWEDEAEQMMESFYKKAAPFALDIPALADVLQPIRDHFKESAERGAETAAKNRDMRKEARDAGLKEGAERARDQAQKDSDKALLDAIGKFRGKLGDGGDKDKG